MQIYGCFQILRTQQQLGYVVQMSLSRNQHFLNLNCLVQTEFPPDHVSFPEIDQGPARQYQHIEVT